MGTYNDIVMGYKAGGLRNGTSSTKNIIMGYECQAGDATDASHHMIRNIIMVNEQHIRIIKEVMIIFFWDIKLDNLSNSDGETGEANAGNIISIGANSANLNSRNWRINIGNTAGGKNALRGGMAIGHFAGADDQEFKQWLLDLRLDKLIKELED